MAAWIALPTALCQLACHSMVASCTDDSTWSCMQVNEIQQLRQLLAAAQQILQESLERTHKELAAKEVFMQRLQLELQEARELSVLTEDEADAVSQVWLQSV